MPPSPSKETDPVPAELLSDGQGLAGAGLGPEYG